MVKSISVEEKILKMIINHMSWNQEFSLLSDNDWITVVRNFNADGIPQTLTRIRINQRELAKAIAKEFKSITTREGAWKNLHLHS